MASTTQTLDGLTPDVRFDYLYDLLGRTASVAATIGATADYVNTYRYDNLGRTTRITQAGDGGNTLAEKRVDFFFDDFGQAAGATRWADLDATDLVARTDRAFDELGRMTELVHSQGETELAYYRYDWDKAGRITNIAFDHNWFSSERVGYSYDATDQLTGADYQYSAVDDESYDSLSVSTGGDGFFSTGRSTAEPGDGAVELVA